MDALPWREVNGRLRRGTDASPGEPRGGVPSGPPAKRRHGRSALHHRQATLQSSDRGGRPNGVIIRVWPPAVPPEEGPAGMRTRGLRITGMRSRSPEAGAEVGPAGGDSRRASLEAWSPSRVAVSVDSSVDRLPTNPVLRVHGPSVRPTSQAQQSGGFLVRCSSSGKTRVLFGVLPAQAAGSSFKQTRLGAEASGREPLDPYSAR